MAEYIERQNVEAAQYDACRECREACEEFDGFYADCNQCLLHSVIEKVKEIPAADVAPVPPGGIGELSDGYHTFNGLYYQRMVLFAALVNAHQDKAWKSWKHEDGKPRFDGGWFIVGIDTPKGSYTYHYEGKYWNWFECEELPVAKHWDGHTEEDVTRLLSLDVAPVRHGRWVVYSVKDCLYTCSECHCMPKDRTNYCPNCGAYMGGRNNKSANIGRLP